MPCQLNVGISRRCRIHAWILFHQIAFLPLPSFFLSFCVLLLYLSISQSFFLSLSSSHSVWSFSLWFVHFFLHLTSSSTLQTPHPPPLSFCLSSSSSSSSHPSVPLRSLSSPSLPRRRLFCGEQRRWNSINVMGPVGEHLWSDHTFSARNYVKAPEN